MDTRGRTTPRTPVRPDHEHRHGGRGASLRALRHDLVFAAGVITDTLRGR